MDPPRGLNALIAASARLPRFLEPEDHVPSADPALPDALGRIARANERLYRRAVVEAPLLDGSWDPSIIERSKEWCLLLFRSACAVEELMDRITVRAECLPPEVAAAAAEPRIVDQRFDVDARADTHVEAADLMGPRPANLVFYANKFCPLHRVLAILDNLPAMPPERAQDVISDVHLLARTGVLQLVQWVRSRVAEVRTAIHPEVVLLDWEIADRRLDVRVTMAGATRVVAIRESVARILRDFAATRTTKRIRNQMGQLRADVPELGAYIRTVPGTSGENEAQYELLAGPTVVVRRRSMHEGTGDVPESRPA